MERQPPWKPESASRYTHDGSYMVHESDSRTGGRIIGVDIIDGAPVECKMPSVHSQRWIDPNGMVVYLAVQSNRRRPHIDHYHHYIIRKKTRKGWLPYDTVPDRGVKATTIDEWKIEREQVIKTRREQYEGRQQRFNEAMRPLEAKLLEGMNKGLDQSMEKLASMILESKDRKRG